MLTMMDRRSDPGSCLETASKIDHISHCWCQWQLPSCPKTNKQHKVGRDLYRCTPLMKGFYFGTYPPWIAETINKQQTQDSMNKLPCIINGSIWTHNQVGQVCLCLNQDLLMPEATCHTPPLLPWMCLSFPLQFSTLLPSLSLPICHLSNPGQRKKAAEEHQNKWVDELGNPQICSLQFAS